MRKIRCLKFFSEGFRIGAKFMFYMFSLLTFGYMYGLEFIPEMELPAPYPFDLVGGMVLLICISCYFLAFVGDRAVCHFESRLHPVPELSDSNLSA